MEYIERILDIKTEYKDWEDRKKIPYFLTDRYSFKKADGVNLLSVNELQNYTLIKVFNFSIILLSFLFHVKIL